MKTLSTDLSANKAYFLGQFARAMDLMTRDLELPFGAACLFALDGLTDKQLITLSILQPLLSGDLPRHPGDPLSLIQRKTLGAVDVKREDDLETLLTLLMSGFAVLCVAGCPQALAFGVQGFAVRSPEEPSGEVMQRGAKDGFTESAQTNMAMLRRRLKTPALKFEPLSVGDRSHTQVILCYVEGAASPALVASVKEKLAGAKLSSVLGGGYLTAFLEGGGLFSGVGRTERPDVVCGKLEEGRAALLVDGVPTAQLVPFLFVENFQTMDDYLTRPFYAAFVRWLKYLAFFVSILLPGAYVGVTAHHPELLPETLMLTISKAEAETPFPVLVETVMLYFLYEMLREAGLRTPRSLSATVGIVGGLVIGDTAVSAGLVSAPSLLVVALTVIAGYTIPRLYEPLSILRLGFLLAGGFFGVWGIMTGFALVLLLLCGETTFGVPLLAPLSPFKGKLAFRDVFTRRSWRKLSPSAATPDRMPGAGKEEAP